MIKYLIDSFFGKHNRKGIRIQIDEQCENGLYKYIGHVEIHSESDEFIKLFEKLVIKQIKKMNNE